MDDWRLLRSSKTPQLKQILVVMAVGPNYVDASHGIVSVLSGRSCRLRRHHMMNHIKHVDTHEHIN